MSYGGLDNEFFFAIRNAPEDRSERECNVVYSRLQHLESLSGFSEKQLRHISSIVRYEFHDTHELLFKKDDLNYCWYILLSGSVYMQGSMFRPYYSFGKQIPGTKRRGCQCLVLEPSEMLAIDYPDVSIHATGGNLSSRQHALRRPSASSTNDRGSVDNVIDLDTSSSEGSPLRVPKRSTLPKTSNGRVVMMSGDNESQSSFSKDLDEVEYEDDGIEPGLDEEDSLSLHSTSSFHIKDLVIDVLKKDIDKRTVDDIEILMEFTKSLVAFSNMTESVRKSLCKAMVFAWVERSDTVVLKDNELLDSWSIIINGQVLVCAKDEERVLGMGETFGVEPNLDSQYHKGAMTTLCDDCQFLCIPQPVYCNLVQLGKDNIEFICDERGDIEMVMEKRESENGSKSGTVLIRGTTDSLTKHMLEENTFDQTYTEDFLLTYRSFIDDPLLICRKLLCWFDEEGYRDKVSRIVLIWVTNHFNDFESDSKMMDLLEEFEEKLNQHNLQGQSKILNMACSSRAKPRVIAIKRQSADDTLDFEIAGGISHQGRHHPIFISAVDCGSEAEAKGVKRGDQLLDVNGQNFEKISFDRARAILKKNTELTLTLKTNLFSFKEVVSDQLCNNNYRKSRKSKHASLKDARTTSNSISVENDTFDNKHKKVPEIRPISTKARKLSIVERISSVPAYLSNLRFGGATQMTVDDSFLTIPRKAQHGASSTIDLTTSRSFRLTSNLSHSDPDLIETSSVDFLNLPVNEAPEDIIKVYKADQTSRFLFVNEDTTAGDVVANACKEFGFAEDEVHDHALYRVSVQSETSFVKQSKLPDPWSKLAEIPLGARYYLKKTTYSEPLLPDENAPELVKEANFSFLDLNCFEVALHLTRDDYKLFQLTEPTNFIDDLFHRDVELQHFQDFEDLVNRELFWVVTTICSETNPLQRSKIIKHFIKIAHHCKVLKNLNSTFALISGLGYRAVSRMKQSWEKVPPKSIRLFDELQALMDPSRNMSKYRTLLNDYTQQPPVIPYIPIVKKDLTFLHLGNDTTVNGLINFEKMRMIAKEVRNVCRLCSPDKSQIIPTAASTQQKEPDKSAIYQTLVRRGRRASFNNLRKMYEDQMNVRRVRQYMKQIVIINDEEKLMEMSKKVEHPAAPSSAQTKRRNTSAAAGSESPSRSSKTLPNQSGRNHPPSPSGTLQSRNNSEPHLAAIPVVTIQPNRKKVPTTSMPKYGNDLHSPNLISRKLMSLSEEAEDRKGRGKKGKETKRSASVSSHEFSPSSSPHMTSKLHSATKQHADSNYTVASENANKNNNRTSLPPGPTLSSSSDAPPSVVSSNAAPKRGHPPHGSSSASSCRSSIASASSLGTMSSSNPSTSSLIGSGGSPRSVSPVSWGSNPSLTAGSVRSGQHSASNSPSRSASGSSTDTVKSTVGRLAPHERPIIKQIRNSRSISYGGGSMVPSSMNDRLSQMTASSSSPALNVNRAQPSLILPNHPRIPRTPSVDSGVMSAGSTSVDSVRFNPTEENHNFSRSNLHGHAPTATRHQASRTSESQPTTSRHTRPPNADQQATGGARNVPRSVPSTVDENKIEKVEQTFLSGCRGTWDAPRPVNKDPNNGFPAAVAHAPLDPGNFSPDVMHHPDHVPPGTKPHHRYSPGKSVLGRGSVKSIHEFLCERQSITGFYRPNPNNNSNNNNVYNPVMQPNFTKVIHTATPEAMLEEQLLMELFKQNPASYSTKRHYQLLSNGHGNTVNVRRLSVSQSDPVGDPQLCPPYPTVVPLKMEQSSGTETYHRQGQVRYQHLPNPGAPPTYPGPHHHPYQSPPQPQRPVTLNNPNLSHRGLNPTEALVMSAYDAMQQQQQNSWPHGAVHFSPTYPHPEEPPNRTTYNPVVMSSDEYHSYQKQKRLSGYLHPSSPMSNRSATVGFDQALLSEVQNLQLQDSPSNHSESFSNFQQPGSAGKEARPPHQQVEGVHHTRRKSQEWNETDLDGEGRPMRSWGSSTSLPMTPVSSRATSLQSPHNLPPHNLQPHLLTGKSSSQEKKANKPPPPPPPQRTTSRPQQAKDVNPTLPNSLNHVAEAHGDDTLTKHQVDDVKPIAKANGHVLNAHPITSFETSSLHSDTNHERRSLPTYDEAVHHKQTKHSLTVYASQLNNSCRSFPTDGRENKERVSQV